jgi:hypothetical protein
LTTFVLLPSFKQAFFSILFFIMVWNLFGYSAPPVSNEPELFECDYERDCSPLYKAIESAVEPKEFDPIVKFLDTGYWSGSFFTDPISPRDQARTWVTRFDPDDSTRVMWSQLPIHLAIVCAAPPAIIGRLVKLFPEGLRCTDDQHMLPLHLALRHGASDEVVAFLIMQFPDAVNASGKSGRSAVECALRAKNKLRGKILEIFVDKSKGKMSSAIVKEHKKIKEGMASKDEELSSLKADFEELANKFDAMKELKSSVEADLLKKIQELETARTELEVETAEKIERLENEKTLESLEHQKKCEILEASLADAHSAEKQAKATELKLRKELENVHGRVAKSRSPDDWEALKIDLGGMEAYRLQCSHTEAKTQIDMLKGELSKTIMDVQKSRSVIEATASDEEVSMVDKELETDLQLIQASVSKLEKTEGSARTAEELNNLRAEVEVLRNELKERTGTNRTKLELTILKKAMETELRNSQGKTEEELNMLRQAVEQAGKKKLDNKTNAELVALKMDMEMLKRQTKNRELVTKTKADLSDLREALDKEIDSSSSKKYRSELITMKKNADLLQNHLEKSDTTESILLLKKSVDHMKDELKKKEATMKIIDEVASLKVLVESELKKSEGKAQEELLQMKKQIKLLTEKDLASKDVEELIKVKAELAEVKNELKEIENATNVQQELESLKKAVANEMKNTSVKAEKELAMMKQAVDEVNMEQKESKSLKKSLTEEIKESTKKTEQELLDLKKALDNLDVKKLETKNKEGWDAIRLELNVLKEELAAKQANKDLASEIDSIKKVVDELQNQKMSTTEGEFKALREDMDAMRFALSQKDQGEAELKKELEALKRLRETKKKNGLTKFFTRHFSNRKQNGVVSSSAAISSGDEAEVKASATTIPLIAPTSSYVSATGSTSRGMDAADKFAEQAVTTIRPPSMMNRPGVEAASSEESSDEEGGSHTTGQLLAHLSSTFVDDAIPAVETVHTEKEDLAVDTASSEKKELDTADEMAKIPSSSGKKVLSLPKINKFRKVQSMDARIASPETSFIPPVRTFSKVVEEDNVIETVETMEDNVIVPTPTPSQVTAAQ